MSADDLSHLQKKIDQAKASAKGEPAQASGGASLGAGMRLAVELVAGIATGSLIGYGVDYFLGTMPVFFIICFFLGAAGGFKNMLREAKKLTDEKEG